MKVLTASNTAAMATRETQRTFEQFESSEQESDGSFLSSSSDEEEGENDRQKRKVPNKQSKSLQRYRPPPIAKSCDLNSALYEEITKSLFELRESNSSCSQKQLDNQTQRWYNYFISNKQHNMAFMMKLVKFKNLYFRKEYKEGIKVLKSLHHEVRKHTRHFGLKDDAYIRGKLAFYLAYAYFAINKNDSAQNSLDCAQQELQFTEGGEEKADMYYFEGKVLDFFIKRGTAVNSSSIDALRMRAVAAYQQSRDNVLLAPRDDYVIQRAMYRSLSMCKVHLDFPDNDTCRSRYVITPRDLERAQTLLQEIDSNMNAIEFTPRFKSRFLLAYSELYLRRSQEQRNNGYLNEAMAEIDNAFNLAAEAQQLVGQAEFVEKQASLKMMDLYRAARVELENQYNILAAEQAPCDDRKSSPDTSGNQSSKSRNSQRDKKAERKFDTLLDGSSSEDSDWPRNPLPVSSESDTSLPFAQKHDRESDCIQ